MNTKKITAIAAALIGMSTSIVFADGDLNVEGRIGVGTSTPATSLHVSKAGEFYWTPSSHNWNGSAIPPNALLLDNSKANGYDPVIIGRMATGTGVLKPVFALGSVGLANWDNSLVGNQISDLYFLVRDDVDQLQERLRIRHNGNIGIGLANPQAKLHIKGGNTHNLIVDNNGSQYTEIDLANNGTIKTSWYWDNNNSLSVFTNGPFYFGGKVGIETSTPAYTLDVNGTIRGNNISPSDVRYKKNLQPIISPIDKILNLSGRSYEWKTDEYKNKGFAEGRHYGVIAQEVEKVLPEVVNTDSKGEKSVAYTEIIPVLIEAIKEQQKRIELLEKRLSAGR